MARFKNIARLKRDISISAVPTSNKIRTRINPNVKYARTIRTEADVINRMLNALEKEGYLNSWASKTLFNKLDTPKLDVIKNGRVDTSKINKNVSMSNLTYIKKALNDFRVSKTSTVKGIESRIDTERQLIAEQTDNIEFAESLSDDEINKIYEVFNSTDYKRITESGEYSSTEVFSFMVEAKEQKYGIRRFMQTIKQYSEEALDRDVRDSFKNIYRKYVALQK